METYYFNCSLLIFKMTEECHAKVVLGSTYSYLYRLLPNFHNLPNRWINSVIWYLLIKDSQIPYIHGPILTPFNTFVLCIIYSYLWLYCLFLGQYLIVFNSDYWLKNIEVISGSVWGGPAVLRTDFGSPTFNIVFQLLNYIFGPLWLFSIFIYFSLFLYSFLYLITNTFSVYKLQCLFLICSPSF